MAEPEGARVRSEIEQIIVDSDGPASALLVRKAQETARQLVGEKGASGEAGKAQLRAVFDEIRQIEALWLTDEGRALRRTHLLKPKLAYRTARAPGLKPLTGLLGEALDVATRDADPKKARERFTRLAELCEAVLAYYTAETSKGGSR